VQVVHVLFDYAGDIFELCEFMTVMFGEHALGADNLVAEFAEVFDLLFRVPTTVDLGG
jgi:hypothetical protein